MVGRILPPVAAARFAPLAVTLAIQAVVSLAILAVPAMAPAIAAALDLPVALLGIYVAIAYAGAMAASLAAGPLVARWGAIRVSQASLAASAAGLAVCALGQPWSLAAGAVLLGLGYGPVTPASSHLLARTTPAHRMSLVFSVKQTGVPLGGVLAGALVPPLQAGAGWEVALLAVAAAALACALLAQPLQRAMDSGAGPQPAMGKGHLVAPMRLVLAEPGLRLLAGCSFVFSIAQVSLTTFLVTYLSGSLAYGLVAAGALLSVAQLGGVLGRVLWGYVADRWLGARTMLSLLALCMAAAAVATALLQPGAGMLVPVVLFLFGACAIGWNGVYLAQVAREAPAGKAGLATGGTLAITFLGVVVGPPLFAALAAGSQSYRVAFAALAVPLVASALALRSR